MPLKKEMNIKCKVKVQSGDRWIWVEGTLIRNVGGSYGYEVWVDDRPYFCEPEELWVNLKDFRDHIISKL